MLHCFWVGKGSNAGEKFCLELFHINVDCAKVNCTQCWLSSTSRTSFGSVLHIQKLQTMSRKYFFFTYVIQYDKSFTLFKYVCWQNKVNCMTHFINISICYLRCTFYQLFIPHSPGRFVGSKLHDKELTGKSGKVKVWKGQLSVLITWLGTCQ